MAPRNVIIAFGGNLGDPLITFSRAREELSRRIGECTATSRVYRSAPMVLPGTDGSMLPPYLNAAAQFASSQPLPSILEACRRVEEIFGRDRVHEKRWDSRTLDLDIVLAENEFTTSPELTVPHPGIADRDFVLLPLQDIAPDLVHPATRQTLNAMLERLQNHFVESVIAPDF